MSVFYLCCVLHQTLSQQCRHHLQLLLSLPDVGVQLQHLLQVAAGGQVVLAETRGSKEAMSEEQTTLTTENEAQMLMRSGNL